MAVEDRFRTLCEGISHPKSGEFAELLCDGLELHLKKSSDYGVPGDPLLNLRCSSEYGIDPWLATAIRANDKTTRLKSFARTGVLENEGVEDTLLDLSAYMLLVLILFREKADNKDEATRHAGAPGR